MLSANAARCARYLTALISYHAGRLAGERALGDRACPPPVPRNQNRSKWDRPDRHAARRRVRSSGRGDRTPVSRTAYRCGTVPEFHRTSLAAPLRAFPPERAQHDSISAVAGQDTSPTVRRGSQASVRGVALGRAAASSPLPAAGSDGQSLPSRRALDGGSEARHDLAREALNLAERERWPCCEDEAGHPCLGVGP